MALCKAERPSPHDQRQQTRHIQRRGGEVGIMSVLHCGGGDLLKTIIGQGKHNHDFR